MATFIEVRPASDQRGPFARWAVRYQVRTASSSSFAVPASLLDRIPEPLLTGALVDGQPWVVPDLAESASAVSDPPPEAETDPEPEAEASVDVVDAEVEEEGPSEIFPSAAPVDDGYSDTDLDAAIAAAEERVVPASDDPGFGDE